jgi:hypothetical protein
MATTNLDGIYDEAGRYLAPAAVVIAARPMGPWDTNAAPHAVYAFHQPAFDGDGPGFPMYHIIGGASDKSTVSVFTLHALGIAVPAAQVAA